MRPGEILLAALAMIATLLILAAFVARSETIALLALIVTGFVVLFVVPLSLVMLDWDPR